MDRFDNQSSLKQAIRRRRTGADTRAGYISLLFRIIIIIALGFLIFTKIFLIMRASGNEMFPAVKDGDLIIAFRMQQQYAKDDLVVYSADGHKIIGRIAAMENDVVTLDDSGTLVVNGTTQGGEILYPTYAKDGITYPFRVPDGCMFVLGDHRTEASDSRDRGAISMENVEGKVITVLRRRGL